MAQITEAPVVPGNALFSLAVPAMVRMNVEASSEAEAAEILAAMFGTEWSRARLDMGWPAPRTGIEFAVQLA